MTPEQLEIAYDVWQDLKKVRSLRELIEKDDSHLTIAHPSGRVVLEFENGKARKVSHGIEKFYEDWLASLDVQASAPLPAAVDVAPAAIEPPAELPPETERAPSADQVEFP
jgi:hypothetical protein